MLVEPPALDRPAEVREVRLDRGAHLVGLAHDRPLLEEGEVGAQDVGDEHRRRVLLRELRREEMPKDVVDVLAVEVARRLADAVERAVEEFLDDPMELVARVGAERLRVRGVEEGRGLEESFALGHG